MKPVKLKKDFFNRSADAVARELLGKILVKKINGKEMRARIVETEAYFDGNDPASRARQNGDLKKTMQMPAGTILVYGIHNSWMLNIVTDSEDVAGAVLIRALEPLNFSRNCSGPGLLTKSLEINKDFHKKEISNREIWIEKDFFEKNNFETAESFRIGVRNDLKEKMRFYIKGNFFVSRR
ncbi:MAG: DNA-3-methyladenine glycosylase [archaeon]